MKKASLLLLFLCLVLSRPALAEGTCAQVKPFKTRVNINLIIPDPVYDLSKSKKELTENSADVMERWLEKNNMKTVWKADDLETLGLASGGSGLVFSAHMRTKNVDRYGVYHCAFFQDINIELFYRTLIFIPTDYPQGTCAFDQINKHEVRHHLANQQAIEKYVNLLKRDIYEIVAMTEEGYVDRNHVTGRFDEMKIALRDAIQIYIHDYIKKETEALNALVDTPEEYKRSSSVMEACWLKDGHKAKRL